METVKTLVSLGSDPSLPSRMNDSPIQCAVRYDHYDILSYFLDQGANPNQKNDLAESSLLSIAAKRGLEKTVLRLLEAGADPLCKGGEPFELAIQQGHFNILKILIESIPENSPRKGFVLGLSNKACFYGYTSFMDDAVLFFEGVFPTEVNTWS